MLRHPEKEEKPKLKAIEQRLDQKLRAANWDGGNPHDERAAEYRREQGTYFAAWNQYRSRRRGIREATLLLVIDEADRLKTASLEQVRALFDQGGIGLVLIGMPGLEKRLARYAQLYSRVCFVHEFGPLLEGETRRLLQEHQWQPAGVTLAPEALTQEEALAAIIRVTGGNFRLLDRLLTQIARVLEINQLTVITPEVVETARESLVIGTV